MVLDRIVDPRARTSVVQESELSSLTFPQGFLFLPGIFHNKGSVDHLLEIGEAVCHQLNADAHIHALEESSNFLLICVHLVSSIPG